ncbi:hypothetical protein DYB28_014821 [Aphanomyces astaci]|uniref:Uncharacterized protein n=1 Tax=Aphanomyces astaci TaxID=112090 RepID=A0A397BW31_APHAT|nr:hypothetical protein DYB36_011674 [Aphanomyces astaci]RHY24818.1 hypothetical protein DYB25_009894 [Aphanomyces astaci]RHY53892.1 hypothetical protein DYB30_009969 [Aphanomyces astaci]RHY54344.1 hypothetical protein DYB38_011125 [Aphanomyces astaci]RHY54843.1 hypothetical protein DYB34_001173 [Aphanomyces astaci]
MLIRQLEIRASLSSRAVAMMAACLVLCVIVVCLVLLLQKLRKTPASSSQPSVEASHTEVMSEYALDLDG